MPINPMDYYFRSFQKEVVPVCLAKDVGVIGMKSLGGSVEGTPKNSMILENTDLTAEQCLRFTLDVPVSSIVRGWTNMDQMMADIRTARAHTALTAQEKGEILALAEPHAGDGRYELFKSTRRFDMKIYKEMHGFPTD